MRDRVIQLAEATYGAEADRCFPKNESFAALRHPLNGKWFGLIATIPGRLIGTDGEAVDILNVKLDPLLIDQLVKRDGFHRAWHMNKRLWITIELDGKVAFDEVECLLDMSFHNVGGRNTRRSTGKDPR